jgi:hypothetical protein
MEDEACRVADDNIVPISKTIIPYTILCVLQKCFPLMTFTNISCKGEISAASFYC